MTSIYLSSAIKAVEEYEHIDFVNKNKDSIRELSFEDVTRLKECMRELDRLITGSEYPGIYTTFYSGDIDQRLKELQGEKRNIITFHAIFSNRRFPLDVINAYPGIGNIRKNIADINNLSKDALINLKNNLVNLQTYYYRATNNIGVLDSGAYYGLSKVFSEDISRCVELLKTFSTTNYNDESSKVQMSEDEEVNGYRLYDTYEKNLFNEDTFAGYVGMWENNEEMPFGEFNERFEEVACSEWSKMDRHGECFGGFWKAPEGSYERENAYTLCREDNIKGLYELPYPKEFVLETVAMGCNNRLESVRYSNAVCEWYRRKRAVVHNREDKVTESGNKPQESVTIEVSVE